MRQLNKKEMNNVSGGNLKGIVIRVAIKAAKAAIKKAAKDFVTPKIKS